MKHRTRVNSRWASVSPLILEVCKAFGYLAGIPGAEDDDSVDPMADYNHFLCLERY